MPSPLWSGRSTFRRGVLPWVAWLAFVAAAFGLWRGMGSWPTTRPASVDELERVDAARPGSDMARRLATTARGVVPTP